jgi:hypothetical protein
MFGPRSKYPFGPDAHYISEDATAEMYFAIQARLGLSKAVLVSGGGYGQTYTHLADTLRQYPDRLRGVVRLPPAVTMAEIVELDRIGVKAARFFGPDRLTGMTPDLLAMTSEVGWHIQFYVERRDTLAEVADVLLGTESHGGARPLRPQRGEWRTGLGAEPQVDGASRDRPLLGQIVRPHAGFRCRRSICRPDADGS